VSYRDIKEIFNINRIASVNNTVDWRPIILSGVNDDIDTATVPEDLTRFNSGQFYFPSTASTLSVVSASANDTSAGTGARLLLIEGLDINWREINEYVTMNGLTPVVTTNSYFRVNFVRVVTSGTGKTNAGNITLTHGATVMRGIVAGESQAHGLVFSTPEGHELYMSHVRFGFNRGAGAGLAEIVNYTFVSTANTRYLGTFYTISEQTPIITNDFNGFALPRVPEKCDTWYTVRYVSSNNTNVSGSVRGTLVKTKIL